MEILGVCVCMCVFKRSENTLISNIIGALSSITHVGGKWEQPNFLFCQWKIGIRPNKQNVFYLCLCSTTTSTKN